MGSTKNFGEYRETLHLANPPCIPFFGNFPPLFPSAFPLPPPFLGLPSGIKSNHPPSLGVYLTDLTFIEDGIPSVIKRTQLINFAKRAKTAEVIRDIQQYQNVPYPFKPVGELQEHILKNMQAAGDVHEMYERSLQVEPREREDEKITRLVELGLVG